MVPDFLTHYLICFFNFPCQYLKSTISSKHICCFLCMSDPETIHPVNLMKLLITAFCPFGHTMGRHVRSDQCQNLPFQSAKKSLFNY